MRNAIGVLLIMIAVVSLASAGEKPKEHDPQKDNGQFRLSKGRAGKVTLGMSVDDLISTYGRQRTKLVDLQAEGDFTPAIAIYVEGMKKKGNKPSLEAIIAWKGKWIINMIQIHDPRFKTDKGIGVGSTLGELKKAHKIGDISFEEGLSTYVIGMTFFLSADHLPEGFNRVNGWNKLPDNEKVLGIAMVAN